jgi:hypothetical protein
MLYVPALGGANKGNRELMERLAANGHACTVVAPAQSPHGPQSREQVLNELSKRNLKPAASSESAEVFYLKEVEFNALNYSKTSGLYVGDIRN